MKIVLLMLFIARATMSFSQTEKTDSSSNECNLPKDFKETIFNKQGRMLVSFAKLKKHVSVENECLEEDIIVINHSDNLGDGMYSLCVKGKKMKYKRMGSIFMKNDENPFDVMKKTDSSSNECNLPKDFKETIFNKQGRMLVSFAKLKKHVSVENECLEEDIIVINHSDNLGDGMYFLCVKGKKMKYKRMGSIFMKNDENPFDVMKGK